MPLQQECDLIRQYRMDSRMRNYESVLSVGGPTIQYPDEEVQSILGRL
jgi:hypothetical protein